MDATLVFDAYRERYESFTFDEHREFYDIVARQYPNQIGFDLALAAEFFRYVRPSSVIEVGGWDGRLAHFVGADTESWVNYELADVPTFCTRAGYEVVLDRWVWDDAPLRADTFVSSHALEHLSSEHLHLLMGALECEWAYIEIPLEPEPRDWRGYFGAHVLPLGMRQFDTLWHEHGWEIAYGTMTNTGFVRFYRR